MGIDQFEAEVPEFGRRQARSTKKQHRSSLIAANNAVRSVYESIKAATNSRGKSAKTDWELWACAAQQIAQHGTFTAEMAAMRADKFLAYGDLEGQRAWTQILRGIHELQAFPAQDTRH